jgi:hypothetical protein
MNTNNLPGFTADTSLYKTSGRYHSVANRAYGNGEQVVISQMRSGGFGGSGGGLSEWQCCVAGKAHPCADNKDKICCDEWEPCTVISPGYMGGIFAW